MERRWQNAMVTKANGIRGRTGWRVAMSSPEGIRLGYHVGLHRGKKGELRVTCSQDYDCATQRNVLASEHGHFFVEERGGESYRVGGDRGSLALACLRRASVF
jgi:hypothetical protein